MSTPFRRAVLASNLLALFVSAVWAYVQTWDGLRAAPGYAFWEPFPAFLFFFGIASLPFLWTLAYVKEGGSEFKRILLLTLMFGYVLVCCVKTYRIITGRPADPLESALLFLMPVAAINAAYLLFTSGSNAD